MSVKFEDLLQYKKLIMKFVKLDKEINLEEASNMIESSRKEKYNNFFRNKISTDEVFREVFYDLSRITCRPLDELKKEARDIAKIISEKGWDERLKVRNIQLNGRILYEREEKITCCDWRKQHIYNKEIWDLNAFYQSWNLLRDTLGGDKANQCYLIWRAFFSESKCKECSEFWNLIHNVSKDDIKKVAQENTRIDLPAERIWVFKCKKKCEVCPVRLDEIGLEKENVKSKHFISGLKDKEIALFRMADAIVATCRLCGKYWAVAGYIPVGLRLMVTSPEHRERLECFDCIKENE